MRNPAENGWRDQAIFIMIPLMLTALFISRPALAITLSIFLALTILHRDILAQLMNFISTPMLVALSLLFFIPFISGAWSDDLREWLGVMRVKLPFLLLPIAFAGRWQLTTRQWLLILYSFLILVALGCSWSLLQYAMDARAIHENYLRAGIMPVPLDGDHVRFSWLVAIAMLACLLQFERTGRTVWLLPAFFFIIYLHVLSARTGLLMAYLAFLCFVIRKIASGKKSYYLWLTIPAALILAGWLFVPTLKKRIQYIRYDLSLIVSDQYRSGTSDGNRLQSLKAGWYILRKKPFGTGAGDIRREVNAWYDKNAPGMQPHDRIYPSSEWMIHGNMAGWLGIAFFTVLVIFPLWISTRHRFFWLLLNSMAIAGLLFESSLEIQYGVFIYCFVMLWWWKWLTFENR